VWHPACGHCRTGCAATASSQHRGSGAAANAVLGRADARAPRALCAVAASACVPQVCRTGAPSVGAALTVRGYHQGRPSTPTRARAHTSACRTATPGSAFCSRGLHKSLRVEGAWRRAWRHAAMHAAMHPPFIHCGAVTAGAHAIASTAGSAAAAAVSMRFCLSSGAAQQRAFPSSTSSAQFTCATQQPCNATLVKEGGATTTARRPGD
jgi:hypothetical protein